ncbi:hypothetical protein JD508_00260 [Aeromonas jandaei]|uniref:lipopolysaccharide biosynthesis protein n=1 Tax=Aeromonas jandaei TaxID=650 RepID=UPI00191C96E8|nr:hypothetical protein [Aeromonas jandaei]MBL0608714.1 hypothetical protein [Aeromonas jandaei]
MTLIMSLQAIFLAPLLITAIGSKLYGTWLIIFDFFVAMQLFDFGISSYCAQRIAEENAKACKEKCSSYFYALVFILVIVASFLSFSSLIVYEIEIPGGFSDSEIHLIRNCIVIGFASVSLNLIGFAFIAPLRALERMREINFFNCLGALSSITISMAGVFLGYGLIAVAVAGLVRSIFSFLGGLLSVFKNRDILLMSELNFQQVFIHVKILIKNAPVTSIGNFATVSLSSFDNLLLAKFVNVESVTIYSVSKKLYDLVRTVLDIYGYSSFGGLATSISKNGGQVFSLTVKNNMIFFMRSSFLCFYSSFLFLDVFVGIWVGREMYIGNFIAGFMAVSMFFAGISNYLNLIQKTAGHFSSATKVVVIEFIIKIIAMSLFVSWLGNVGMPISIFLAALVNIVVAIASLDIKFREITTWFPKSDIYLFFISIFIISLLILLNINHYILLGLKVIIFIVFLLAMYRSTRAYLKSND